MSRAQAFNIPLTAERLTAYAVERQNGIERHVYPGDMPWTDQRRRWSESILQGMLQMDGRPAAPELMCEYDQRLKEAHSTFGIKPLLPEEQAALIQDLSTYVSALEASDGDRRQQIDVVRSLMKDIYTNPSWTQCRKELERNIRSMTDTLMRMTAQRPIRFTYLILSGYQVSCTGDFVSGMVRDAEAVKATELYQRMEQWHPKMKQWLASCMIYVGGNGDSLSGAVDATDFDMDIIREDDYRFLKQPGLRAVDHVEIDIPIYETIQVLKVKPGMTPEAVTMPNTLEAFQRAVGGYIEALGMDAGFCLICNEKGKLLGLPANRRVGNDVVAGTFLIAGEADGEFCSLSDEDLAYYAEQFAEPMLTYDGQDEPTQWEFYVL